MSPSGSGRVARRGATGSIAIRPGSAPRPKPDRANVMKMASPPAPARLRSATESRDPGSTYQPPPRRTIRTASCAAAPRSACQLWRRTRSSIVRTSEPRASPTRGAPRAGGPPDATRRELGVASRTSSLEGEAPSSEPVHESGAICNPGLIREPTPSPRARPATSRARSRA